MIGTEASRMNLEVMITAVSDVDRAKRFYEQLGWRLDDDVTPMDGLRIVQLTPPGSGTSITFGAGLTTAAPGSAEGNLVVSDIEAAHDGLAARGIAVSNTVPVTVDLERGYGLGPEELVERLAATGAVGMNLEDSDPPSGEMVDAAEQTEFLASVRSAALSAGINLVINARTDSFRHRAGSPAEQLSVSIDRGQRYLAAGADCVYPIGTSDPVVIRALVDSIPGPVNIGYGQGSLSLAQLGALGVARVSFGPILQLHLYRKFLSALLSAVAADENPWAL